MTDQEKNEAVARKMGWRADLPASSPVGDADGCLWIKGSDTSKHYRLPNYCHSIEAAWGIVEHIRKDNNLQIDLHIARQNLPSIELSLAGR